MNQSKMRVLSLCSGIGGIDLAAEWAGMEIVGQVEIDEFCAAVLQRHWPQVKRMRDIRKVVGDEFGTVDLVVGGIPCQPFSVAGKRRGTTDDRHLWPEMLRIVERCQPAFVLVENVAGFVGVVLDEVSADLESRGYAARAFVLPAAAVGAPHLRERVFVVVVSNGHRWLSGADHRQEGPLQDNNQWDIAQGEPQRVRWQHRAGSLGADVANTCGQRRSEGDPAVGDAARQSDWRAAKNADLADATHGGLRRGQPSRQPRQPARGGEGVGQADTCGKGLQGQGTQRSVGQSRQTQPRLGGAVDGLSAWLDNSRWPAGPGEAQHDWEAPRTTTGTIPYRAARLKALGNAVVPQQVYPILAAIAAVWHGSEVA